MLIFVQITRCATIPSAESLDVKNALVADGAARLVYPFCGVINSCNMVQKKGRPSAALRPPPLFGGPLRLFADGIAHGAGVSVAKRSGTTRFSLE